MKETLWRRDRRKLRRDKDELEKRNLKLQNMDSQYKAALRKKEAEYDRLQKRLQALMAHTHGIKPKRGLEASCGATVTFCNKPGNGDVGTLNRAVMEAYTKKHAALEGENQHMRTCLERLQHELHALRHQKAELLSLTDLHSVGDSTMLAHCGNSHLSHVDSVQQTIDCVDVDGTDQEDALYEEILPAQFQLPFDLASATIEKGIRAQIQEQHAELHSLVRRFTERFAGMKSRDITPVTSDRPGLLSSLPAIDSGNVTSAKEVKSTGSQMEVALEEALTVVAQQDHLLQLVLSFDADQREMEGLNTSFDCESMGGKVEILSGLKCSSMHPGPSATSSKPVHEIGSFPVCPRTPASVISFQSPLSSGSFGGVRGGSASPTPLSPFCPPPATPVTAALLRTRIGAAVEIISRD